MLLMLLLPNRQSLTKHTHTNAKPSPRRPKASLTSQPRPHNQLSRAIRNPLKIHRQHRLPLAAISLIARHIMHRVSIALELLAPDPGADAVGLAIILVAADGGFVHAGVDDGAGGHLHDQLGGVLGFFDVDADGAFACVRGRRRMWSALLLCSVLALHEGKWLDWLLVCSPYR